MSGPQVLGISSVGPTAAVVLPNTGLYHWVIVGALALTALGLGILAVQISKRLASKPAK